MSTLALIGPYNPTADAAFSLDHASYLIRSRLVDIAADVRVDVTRYSDRAVTETLLHHLQRDASAEGGRGVGVTKIMQADHGQPGFDGKMSEPL
jgi:hypothetical protein